MPLPSSLVHSSLVVPCCLRLGLGDTVNRGDKPGTMGDNLQPVDLGTGESKIRVLTAAAPDLFVYKLYNHEATK